MRKVVKRIKLTLEEAAGVNRRRWPVTQGVPFAEGELERGAPVRVVNAAGKPLPTQAYPLATWAEDLRHVKWLLVDFQTDLRANGTNEVFLEYGKKVTATPPSRPIKIKERHDAIQIDTGALQVTFRLHHPDFFAACRIKGKRGWKDLCQGSPGLYLYMTDQTGRKYNSYQAAPPPVITLEEAEPMRASVCIKGFHASADGRRFCPYILRMHFFAQKADIRCFHTFIFDQDPERLELAEIGIRLPLDLGGKVEAALGGEKPRLLKRFRHAQLLQSSHQAYRLESDGRALATGEKSLGWATLRGSQACVAAVVRDIWREFPKALLLDKTGLDLQIWPAAQKETLKFTTPFKENTIMFNSIKIGDEAGFRRLLKQSPTRPLNLKSFGATKREEIEWIEKMVAKYAPRRPASYNDTGTSNGFGAAKSTEFLLRFSAEPIPLAEAEALGKAVQEPVVAVVDTNYVASTDALRLSAPLDTQHFSETEACFDSIFERVVAEPRRVLQTYGLIDWGDLMCSHSVSAWPVWQLYKNDPQVLEKTKHLSRSYNNEANDQVYALWGFYTHTGNRKHFLTAEAYGEHMADVDIVHATPDGSPPGLMHYHNAAHWSGYPIPSHTCITGLMLQYYLTGNRRILEVCREVADWVVASQGPRGLYQHRGLGGVREYTTPVQNLLEFYQGTWEYKYGDLARRSLKWFLLTMEQPGCFPESVFTAGERGDAAEVLVSGWTLCQAGGMTPQLLYDATRLWGQKDPAYKAALLGMAHRYLWGLDAPQLKALEVGPAKAQIQDPYFNASLIAYAYILSEDPTYAAFCRYYLREYFPKEAQDLAFLSIYWGSLVPPLMEAVRRAEAKFGHKQLERAEQAWVKWVNEAALKLPQIKLHEPLPASSRALGPIAGYEAEGIS